MVSLMSLEALRVEEQDLSSDDLLLEADTGESLEVQAVGVSGCNDNDTIQIAIGEETMSRQRCNSHHHNRDEC